MRPYDSRDAFERFATFSSERFTDLYCQVYRGGRSWFASTYADETPYRESMADGVEPLAETIAAAHARGQRVHAWLNLLRVDLNRDAPIIRKVGPSAVLQDNYGRSLLDYGADGYPPHSRRGDGRLDTPGIWLDPTSRDVRKHLVALIRELAERYPTLDGIHLDMARFPFITGRSQSRPLVLGYSPDTLQRFFETTQTAAPHQGVAVRWKLPAGSVKVASDESWNEWRRQQLTQLVFEIRESLNEVAPRMELSAAVLSSQDRARNHALQDWGAWAQGGLVQYVVPMTYTKSLSTFTRESQTAIQLAGRERVIVGLGAWMMVGAPEELVAQVRKARALGAVGVSLFSYSNLFSKPGVKAVRRAAESALRTGK